MRTSAFFVVFTWFVAVSALAAPLDDVSVTPLPGPASCYAGTAGTDNVIFLRTKIDPFDCDFSGGGQICLNRREFAEDGANGRPVSLLSPVIQRSSVTGAGDLVVFTELGFNACLMLTGSRFDEGCLGRDGFGIDPYSISINPAGTQMALTRIDLGVFPNVVMNEIYIINAGTLALEESHAVTPGGNPFLQIETVDFTVDGEYLIIDAFDPNTGLWAIYAVNRSNSAVTAIVPPVAGLHLRNPALAQTSDDHIVFDAYNFSTFVNTVFAANLLSGELVQVATTGLLSYPGYTGDDRAVVFSEADNSVSTTASLDIQPLATDRLTPQGNRSRYLSNGGAGEIYRRGTWDGTLKDSAECGEAASADLDLQVIDAEEGAYLPGSNINIFTQVENISSASSGTFSINYYLSTDTDITAGDTLLGSFSAASMGAAEVLTGNIVLALPNGIGNGMFYVGAILDISDSNAANNTSHDPTAIEVSTDPDIQVRSLTLNFNLEPPAVPATSSDSEQLFADYQLPHTFQDGLLEKVRREGMVRVIVGFETPFRPEGRMTGNELQVQRQGIELRGTQLLNSLRAYRFKQNARYQFIPFVALTVNERALEHLSNSALVTSIVEDIPSYPFMATSNQVIGSPLAWAEGFDGTGQTVAILDTGVDKTHPWFTNGGSKVVSEACYSSNIPEQGATSLCPGAVESSTASGSGVNCEGLCNHGSHVAGIAAGNDGSGPGFGVAQGADLIAIQVFTRLDGAENCSGAAACVVSYPADQISALERVFELRTTYNIASVNMSLGGGQYFNQATCDADNVPIKAAIDNLRSAGIATVIASGNDGFRDSISAPGCVSTAISVGNTRRNDEVSGSSNIYPEIHLLAPGTDIVSSIPGTGTEALTGTSMAAPHVAGALAVMKEVFPNDSVSDILGKLQSTATPVSDGRPGGVETSLPRINLDLAIGEPRTTFGIFNTGPGVLSVTSITAATQAPWISWLPVAPFDIPANEMKVIAVAINYDLVPPGLPQKTRLLIHSNDPDESPFPDGVFINVSKSGAPDPEFDSTPAAGPIAFGNVPVLSESPEQSVTVRNIGAGSLTVSCSLTGANPSEFNLAGCPITGLANGASGQIAITCKPAAPGIRSATLRLTTNDSDEGTVDFNLSCFGITVDMIFIDGFESGG